MMMPLSGVIPIMQRPGQQFCPGSELRLEPGFIQCYYIVSRIQATCVLTPHVNAVNGVT